MREKDSNGFTSIDFTGVLAVIAVLILFAIRVQGSYIQTAYETVLTHDVTQFARIIVMHYHRTGRCIAKPGDTYDGRENSKIYRAYGFRPSEDVRLVVVSGDPGDPYNPDNPYVIRAEHSRRRYEMIYNLHTLTAQKGR